MIAIAQNGSVAEESALGGTKINRQVDARLKKII
jgi:hypothetical protein